MMVNPIDRLVGFFDPDRGLRRHRSRELLKRAYEGASKRDGWRPKRPGASADTDHAADAATLRVRSRALMQNVPYMAQGLRSLVANVVGTGIVPHWTGPEAATYDRLWAEWAPHADADGRLDVYGLQAMAYRAMEQDGEVLVRIRPRRDTDGLPVPLQFQLLEIDWLDASRNETRDGRLIVNGIEFDRMGKRTGYWLFDEHPGDITTWRRARTSSHFVPAESIIHLYSPERPGQGRGFPRAAPVIARVRDLQLYQDAEIHRKNLESRLGVLASGDVSLMANDPVDITQPGDPDRAKQTGDLGALPSGGIMSVPDGVNLTPITPQAPPGYVDYVKYELHLIAAGWGVTYEMMTGDMRDVNFSSARVRMLDFRREAEMTQWLTLIPVLCNRMCRAFADAAYLAGKVKRPNYQVEHATPKWDYVNPQQDVKADLEEIGGGLSSLSEKLRRRGYKPDQVFKEIASDLKKLQKLGVFELLPFFKAAGAPSAAGAEPKGEASDGEK
jgi:lambda family phage portal protein